ncbi:MAG: hypothetical protein GYB68_01950 [Chloroflexi bacterium]|nr:hypothetical protein [Chloroflexota bacterium]
MASETPETSPELESSAQDNDEDAEEDATEEEPSPTEPPAEPTATIVEATETPLPTEAPSLTVLLVAEDELSGRPEWTSADEIASALDSLDVTYDRWRTYQDGQPGRTAANEYDVIIWAVGDDCCDSPTQSSLDTMLQFLDDGGRILIEGGAVISPWPNTPFVQDYLSIRHDGWSPVVDLTLSNANHPLAEGFSGDTLNLSVNSRVRPDAVETRAAVAVFSRGPNSAQSGNPVITAYDSGSFKTVYSSVPLQWMRSNDRRQLIENALNWFAADD